MKTSRVRSWVRFSTLVLLGLALAPGNLQAAARDHTVRFIPSTTPGVTRYVLSVGDSPGNYHTEFDLGLPTPDGTGVSSRVVQIDDAQDQYLALRAYNGLYSSFSNTVVVAAATPECVTNGDCGDGLACNGAERCVGGSCQAGTPLTCSDPGECQTAACDDAIGCVVSNLPNGTVCDDGDAATTGDSCFIGVCSGTVPLPTPECVTNADCSDLQLCNGAERCVGGSCQAGTPLTCSDPGECQTAACDDTLGCVVFNLANGTACDDGDAATTGDRCFVGVCSGTVPPPECVTNADCSDLLLCNGAERCVGGSCQAGTPLTCSDPGPCRSAACDDALGCVVSNLANGTACDDGDATTTGDSCFVGTCAGTPMSLDNTLSMLAFTASADGTVLGVELSGAVGSVVSDAGIAGLELHPAWCDLEGDGEEELVLGFGTGGGGRAMIVYMVGGVATSTEFVQSGRSGDSGEIFPACGDLDGDKKDELVLGPGAGGGGYIQVLDDATSGFAPLVGDGWIQWTTWSAYVSANGAGMPAVGDFDGDGLGEIAIGYGAGGAGWILILDDAQSGLAPFAGVPRGDGWIQWTSWASYLAAHGGSFPAAGDLDGDGRDELVLGLGTGGKGSLYVLDDAGTAFAPFASVPGGDGWVGAGWAEYNSAGGATFPSVGDVDGDGVDEIIIGFGTGGEGTLQVLDDASAMLAPHASAPSAGGFVSGAAQGTLRGAARGSASMPGSPPDPPPDPTDEPGASIDGAIAFVGSSSGEISGVAIDGSLSPVVTVPSAAGLQIHPIYCDLRGDGEHELVVGLGPGGGGRVLVVSTSGGVVSGVETITTDRPGNSGETIPACGDVDGDGRDELVIGLGDGSGGYIRVLDDAMASYAPLSGDGWIQWTTWSTYLSLNGAGYPAVGDFDGDGRDEIAIGYGDGGAGWLVILEDAASGFAPSTAVPRGDGWIQWTTWSSYVTESGAAILAAGDLDGDGRDELVIGLGKGGKGSLYVLDDAMSRFAPFGATVRGDGWIGVGWDTYNAAGGPTFPAVCDVDSDGVDEIIVGFGSAGAGVLQILDDAGSLLRPLPSVPELNVGAGAGPLRGASR